MTVDLLSMFLTIKHHEGKKLDISELDLKNFLLVTVELQRENTCEKHLGEERLPQCFEDRLSTTVGKARQSS